MHVDDNRTRHKGALSFVLTRLLEALVFAGGFFLIDVFVVRWFDTPQWWYHWINNKDIAFEAAVDIAQRRQSDDIVIFFIAFSLLIVAYYLALYAHRVYRARALASTALLADSYNRKIIALRFASFFAVGMGLAIASIPVFDSTRTQQQASHLWAMLVIAGITALLLGFLPYYLFRKLSHVLTFGYSLLVTASCFALMIVGLYFHLHRATIGLANILFLLMGYTTRLKELSAVWNRKPIGTAGDNP